jgi:exosortase A
MSDNNLAVETQIGHPEIRLAWVIHGGILAGLFALLFALNWNIVRAAFIVWQVSPTYSHCFFILPISAFLIWLRRRQLSTLAPAADPSALVWLIPLIGFDLVATIASITEAQQIALIGMVQVLTWAILGRRVYGQILFPMLYLFFLIPMGEYLVGPLQNFTARFISVGLSVLGILHHTEGTVIELVGGTFRVAEACAGLRFLIATIAVGALFSYLNYRKWYKIAAFLFACATVPVIANGFRALGIVLLAWASNNRIATGADHLVYGWGFSVVILAILMLTGARYADRDVEAEPQAVASSAPVLSNGFLLPAMLALAAVCAIPAFRLWDSVRPIAFDRSALANPLAAANWQSGKPSPAWSPAYITPDYHLQYSLSRAEQLPPYVDVNVLYYARSQNGHGLISSANAIWNDDEWHLISQGSRTVVLGARQVPVQEVVISSRKGIEMVWWTFWEGGRFTTSAARVKFDSLRRAVSGHDGSALVAVSTPVDSDVSVAEGRLEAALPSLNGLPEALDKAAGRSPDPAGNF